MAESWVIPSKRKAPRFGGSQTLIVKLLRGDLCRRGFKDQAPGVAVVLHAALVAYFKLLRMAAQACDTPESAALLPGMVAQPRFSMYAACSHVLVFFRAIKL
jgi:hypothetical protein